MAQDHAASDIDQFPPFPHCASFDRKGRYGAKAPAEPLLYSIQRIARRAPAHAMLLGIHPAQDERGDHIGDKRAEGEPIEKGGTGIELGQGETEDSPRRREEDGEHGAVVPCRRSEKVEEKSDQVGQNGSEDGHGVEPRCRGLRSYMPILGGWWRVW